jgi:hypothetical protein
MDEEWRPVPGFEGQYAVSNLGRCRSLDRTVMKTTRGRPVPHRLKGRVLTPGTGGRGYLIVAMHSACTYVHRLVLAAFVGPRPAGMEAAHGNGDKTDESGVESPMGDPQGKRGRQDPPRRRPVRRQAPTPALCSSRT